MHHTNRLQCCVLSAMHGICKSCQMHQQSSQNLPERAPLDKVGGCAAGTAAAEYFDLVEEQVADAAAAAHLVAHDMLTSLMHHIKLHITMLLQAEYGCSLDILGPLNTKDQAKAGSIGDMHARYSSTDCAQGSLSQAYIGRRKVLLLFSNCKACCEDHGLHAVELVSNKCFPACSLGHHASMRCILCACSFFCGSVQLD